MRLSTKFAGVSAAIFALSILPAISACATTVPAPAPTPTATAAPTNMSYVVIPHPDDEFETWSLVERSPNNYKTVILLTHGEETGYCGTQKWTAACGDKRISSFVSFFQKMSAKDATIPGDFTHLGVRGPFAAKGVSLTRNDGGKVHAVAPSADVYVDKKGRGALVIFDLGDGDLTESEAVWAIQTTISNRAALGINAKLPNYNAVGAYYNSGYKGCATYTHPDHYAVHRALYNHDFKMKYQSAATCKSDPDARRTQSVTTATTQTAWGSGAAFKSAYGWLADYSINMSPFFQSQSFWTRYTH